MLVACVWHFGNLRSYANLATIKDNQRFLLSYIHDNPLASSVLYILIFFLLTLTALPVTLVMITIGGFLFGPFLGSLYTLVALLASGVSIFKLSKKMFGYHVQEKYSRQLKRFNDNFKKYGFYYLILVRTLPLIPFFIINMAAGLTHIPTRAFVLSTAIGALPMVVFCSYLGSQCAALIVNW
jgi:uncharacterized membrane protein YdjX (TVP38/TMEM64 family)